MKRLDFLAIGHLCFDIVDGRRILGGSASYASLTARELGQKTGILTAIPEDFPLLHLLNNISITNIGSPSATTFKNVYHNGIREQMISSVARSIQSADVPEELRDPSIVYLCPIANEVAPDVAERFEESLIGAGAQGWFRKWDRTGHVMKKKWEAAIQVAESVDAIIYSDLDADEPYVLAEELAKYAPIVIVTQSDQGADVFTNGRRIHVPAFEINEVDPTGAGDVFAAAFLFDFNSSGDAVASAKFACCAASFVCEQEGTRGIPTHQQVLARLHEYNVIYSESTV